ncbi:MAG: hypothetical protein U5L96_17920 [Owenweeksia sp.]|nr:hypothetical protein [Owenweeksia sp.]
MNMPVGFLDPVCELAYGGDGYFCGMPTQDLKTGLKRCPKPGVYQHLDKEGRCLHRQGQRPAQKGDLLFTKTPKVRLHMLEKI